MWVADNIVILVRRHRVIVLNIYIYIGICILLIKGGNKFVWLIKGRNLLLRMFIYYQRRTKDIIKIGFLLSLSKLRNVSFGLDDVLLRRMNRLLLIL